MMPVGDPTNPGTIDPSVSPPSRRIERRGFPLRVHIATLFVVLIATAGLAVVGYGYLATSRLLLSAGDEEFLHVAERTAGQVRDLLAPAQLLVQLLTRHPLTRTTSLGARLETLPLLTATLSAHPQVSAIYIGFESGDFYLVRSLGDTARHRVAAPPEAVYLVQSRAATDPVVAGRYLFLDTRLGVVRDEPRGDYRFDPRTRDWYQRARGSDALVRTDPYVFFTTREVGTTVAARSADGGSVIGVDITLQDLSRHLGQSNVTPSARLALVDQRGHVIAHPDATRLVRSGSDGSATLIRVHELGDPALEPLFAAATPASRATPLRIGGRAWIGAKRLIDADVGDTLTLLVAAPRNELIAGARSLAQQQVLIGLGVIGLTLGLVWLFARQVARPLEALTRSVRQIGQGDLETALPEVTNPLEVAALTDVTDRMRVQIKVHIAERVARLADEQRRVRELDIARQIQQSMLPPVPQHLLGARYAIAGTLRPAREVGGDLYDFFQLDDRRLMLAIADVADKGVPAALLMARVTGLVRAIGRTDGGPDGVLRELDVRLSQGNDTCMFVTMACVELDGESGEFRYASAGHERPLVRRVDGTTTAVGFDGGPVLGLGLGRALPLWTGRLAPGDALVLHTDGVTEAFDAAGDAFGLERFRRVVAETPVDALGTLPDRLVEAVERFATGGAPRDDLALLVVQFRPPDVTIDGLGAESWWLSVSSEPGELARVQRWTETILRARGLSAPLVHDCSLLAEEVLTNIMEHAYGGRAGTARFAIRLGPEAIQLRFEDTGPPFNPIEHPPPDLDTPIAARPVGGVGIVLVKHLADRCEYAREGSTNVLTVCRTRPPEPSTETARAVQEPLARGGGMALEIEITSERPDGRRVALRGRLDTATAPQLEAQLTPLLHAPGVGALVFDLDGLDYISSAGIRCLVWARKLMAERRGHVAIVNPQPAVKRVFEIVKALPPQEVFASEAEFDAYLDAMQRRARKEP
jgi:sigma-B regulation protein RsbU (phosphoserine phosphatase)